MFGNKKNGHDQARPMAPTSGNGKRGMFSMLSPDIVVTGNIEASADLHIDGRIEGDVACAALVQGSESHIVGSIRADAARIAGTVEGGVQARELIVEAGAVITGDVEYQSISIETGAQVDGRLKHVTPRDSDVASGAAQDGLRLIETAEAG
ncbi:bactofilin family protein [Stakelama marina]|uniref:Polymer-forming cytoskeletal protein n=1 Tax=Stakelama marina TaxID=2826939 RepID=A0A8T4IGN6_9SPHN|nr:polymer-forming cytoskeletal protein [Stakelama marina]MBR0552225.1 polymer-forming cytoskeletal protein [Stakelama marina]